MTDIENYDVEDASVSLLRFESGTVGYVATGCVLKDGGAAQVGLRFDGRDYSVRISGNTIEVASGGERTEEDFQDEEPAAMALADGAFVDAVRTGEGDGIMSDYSDGLKSLAVTLAANESLATGEEVRISEFMAAAR